MIDLVITMGGLKVLADRDDALGLSFMRIETRLGGFTEMIHIILLEH